MRSRSRKPLRSAVYKVASTSNSRRDNPCKFTLRCSTRVTETWQRPKASHASMLPLDGIIPPLNVHPLWTFFQCYETVDDAPVSRVSTFMTPRGNPVHVRVHIPDLGRHPETTREHLYEVYKCSREFAAPPRAAVDIGWSANTEHLGSVAHDLIRKLRVVVELHAVRRDDLLQARFPLRDLGREAARQQIQHDGHRGGSTR